MMATDIHVIASDRRRQPKGSFPRNLPESCWSGVGPSLPRNADRRPTFNPRDTATSKRLSLARL
jgi:hypothetical protein